MKGYSIRVDAGLAEITYEASSTTTRVELPGVTLREYIGSGANGIVFSGIDLLDRSIAVKIYPPRTGGDGNLGDLNEKAVAEVKKAANLKHKGSRRSSASDSFRRGGHS